MPLRNAKPLTWRPRGLSDATDGSNAFPGAMASLQNLVPAPHTAGVFMLRPASVVVDSFASFTTPGQGEALFVNGPRQYGFVQSGRFPGQSEPFVYDASIPGFVAIGGLSSGLLPTQTANAGDWVPPTVTRVGGRVLFTHPGFTLPNAFGWLDMTGFADGTKTGNTNSSTAVNGLSANVLLAGWRPGMTILSSSGDIPAGTRIASIAANGLALTLSAAATGSHAVTFSVAGGTSTAPLWCAGNVNGLPLLAVASCVAQFSGRAYYGVGSAIEFSDEADPLQASGGGTTQIITFGNGLPVTAMKPLGVYQTQGGVLQSLVVFQGASAISQITGDIALNSLALNELSESSGTLAPNSCAQIANLGLAFIAPDGMRVVTPSGQVSEPIGLNGQGIAYPFINAVNPSRICAAYNDDVYRISVTGNVLAGGQAQSTVSRQEFWYHLDRKVWSGPHTFPADLIAASQTGQAFYLMPSGAAGLWSSDTKPTFASGYTENGAPVAYLYQTCRLPDTELMAENAIVETSLTIGLPADTPAIVVFSNEAGVVLDSQTISIPIPPVSLWGSMIWGLGLWGSGAALFEQRQIPWAQTLVFKQGQVSVYGQSTLPVVIGNLYLKYQVLGYLMQGLINAA